jgi:ribonuclease HI
MARLSSSTHTTPLRTETDTFDPSHGVIVFTDGSASVKNRTGGWAWIALDSGDGRIDERGGEEDTTIGRMELTAVVMALESLAEMEGVEDVLVVSDSAYVVDGFNDKTRARNKNGDLWGYLETAAATFRVIEFEHIHGHQKGVEGYWNNCADKAAVAARKVIVDSQVQPKKG